MPGEHQANQFLDPVFDAAGNYIGGVHHRFRTDRDGHGSRLRPYLGGNGHLPFDMTSWTMTYNRGHNQLIGADLAALCDYLDSVPRFARG